MNIHDQELIWKVFHNEQRSANLTANHLGLLAKVETEYTPELDSTQLPDMATSILLIFMNDILWLN